MDLGLAGKTALVTGGSEGIGKGIALALAREGVDVAICARRREPLEAAAAAIAKDTGRKAVAIPADLTKDPDAKNFVEQAHRALGRVDIMVNNAGSAPGGVIEHLSEADWAQALGLKFMGYVRCLRYVLPIMVRQSGGRVVKIENPVDDGLEPMQRNGGIHAFELATRADEHTVYAGLFAKQAVRAARRDGASEHADQGNAPADRHRGNGTAQRARAADFEYAVDAAPAGLLQHLAFPLRGAAIIDAARGAELARVLELGIAGGEDQHSRAGNTSELQRKCGHPAGSDQQYRIARDDAANVHERPPRRHRCAGQRRGGLIR